MSSKSRLFIDKLFGEENFINEFNKLAEKLETFSSTISLVGNTRSQLFEGVEVKANDKVKLTHNLEQLPKHRLVLRQSKGGIILDGKWDNKSVEFINNTGGDFLGDILLLGGE